MRLLLDTHVVLWWLDDSSELSGEIKDLLDTEPGVYVSAVTPWEICIKQSLGKLDGPEDWPNGFATVSSRACPSQRGTGCGPGGFQHITAIPSTAY